MSFEPYLTPPPTLPHTRANSNERSNDAIEIDPRLKYPSINPPLHTHMTITSVEQHLPFEIRLAGPRLPPHPAVSTVRPDHSHDENGFEDDGYGNPRGDKRRRTTKGRTQLTNSDGVLPSPSQTYPGSGQSPPSPHHHPYYYPRGLGLPPINPGFAASRESRREDRGDLLIPSPVVMGFDFKTVDEEQLKTVGSTDQAQRKTSQAEAIRSQVRDTISIKEQQQALIAQRRKEVAASTPSTPKELTFKGWVHPDQKPSVGKRREKTKDKVEAMTIITNTGDRDVVPGSKVGAPRP